MEELSFESYMKLYAMVAMTLAMLTGILLAINHNK